MASPHLMALPVELLCLVASYLDNGTDYGSLRLTCKHAEESLFGLFAKKYFSHFQAIRTDFSLQTLVDISKSRFAPYMKQIILGTEVPEEQYPLQYPDISRHYNVDEPVVDQETFLSSGCDREMLIEAFKGLPLEVVGIRDETSMFPPIKRRMEHSPLRKRSYGYHTVARSRGGGCQYWDLTPAVSCLRTLLDALGRANAKPKKLVSMVDTGNLDECALEISCPERLEILKPMLHQLKELELEISARAWTQNLRLFLGNTDGLQALRLHFNYGMNDRYKGFLSWLAAPCLLGEIPRLPPPPVSFPHLRSLDLEKVTVEPNIMLAAIRKFSPTLQSLGLSHIQLSMHLPFHTSLPDFSELPKPWEDFMDGLLEFSDTLSTIYLSKPMDDFTGNECASRRHRVFRVRGAEFQTVSYSGPSMQKALEGIFTSLAHQDSFWEPDLIGQLMLDDVYESPMLPSQEESGAEGIIEIEVHQVTTEIETWEDGNEDNQDDLSSAGPTNEDNQISSEI